MMHLPRRHYAAVIIAAIILLVAVVAVIPAAAFVFTTPFTPLALFDVSNNYRYSHNLLSKRGGALNSNRRDNDSFIRETAATSIEEESEEEGIRLNKVFKATHSRRAADKLIEEGRVTVNGQRVHERGGYKVVPFRDVVALDGKVVKGWEQINAIARDNADVLHQKRALERNNKEQQRQPSNNLQTSSFEYVKYYKPIGVTCTTDLRVKDNIIDAINNDGYKARHRVYPVGRLDKETSGLIILTSDGRIVNAVLRGERKQPKVYKVKVDGVLEDRHLQRLRDGIIIRTVSQRKGRTEEENTLIAKTKRCKVERIGPSSVEMTLVEGRNRQIRKMMEAIGFNVVKLHRIEFMGIKLSRGLNQPGDWDYLNDEEMNLVKTALRSAQQEEEDGRGYI